MFTIPIDVGEALDTGTKVTLVHRTSGGFRQTKRCWRWSLYSGSGRSWHGVCRWAVDLWQSRGAPRGSGNGGKRQGVLCGTAAGCTRSVGLRQTCYRGGGQTAAKHGWSRSRGDQRPSAKTIIDRSPRGTCWGGGAMKGPRMYQTRRGTKSGRR